MVDVDPPPWSRKACCEMNSRQLAEHEGSGVLVYGYKIWANEKYAEAIPHCILERPDGSYIDPTFNVDGERRVLFVRDNEMETTILEHLGQKPCIALDPELDLIVRIKVLSESRIALHPMSEEEAWASEITYVEYLRVIE